MFCEINHVINLAGRIDRFDSLPAQTITVGHVTEKVLDTKGSLFRHRHRLDC